ncbi:MAG TPA: CBS domain-containing protein [Actinomycetota bacterium]|nr:CBS domain-containing protein [Actinomycetota bacterium]
MMLVRDVMSVRLLTVRPDTPVREIARTMVRNRIGGVPVVDDEGRILGIVSGSDLQPLHDGAPRGAVRTAGDVMTRQVVTLPDDVSVTLAARMLRRSRVKRAPVVRAGRVVGIVTTSDLLRPYLRTDSEIRADVEEALLDDVVVRDGVRISVESGLVRLEGRAGDRRQQAVLVRLARSVDGVIDVEDRLEVA